MTGIENIFYWTQISVLQDPYIRHLAAINNTFTIHLTETKM
jgi:hypothetical protein